MPLQVPKLLTKKPPLLSVLGLLGLLAVTWIGSIGLRGRLISPEPTPSPTIVPTEIFVATSTTEPTLPPIEVKVLPTFTQTPSPTPTPVTVDTGVFILAMSDGTYTHLFAYHPESLPLTRLTDNPWDDQQPAVSPDGTKIAFSSRRNGYWDIYILDLNTNDLIRVSDTPQYDGSPTWSPDGQWLAFESYIDSNLEIVLQSLGDLTQPPIQLTNDPAPDFSPVWSPKGRHIAFVSSRSGDEDIWLANLDQVENRYKNISQNGDAFDITPAWSPDGDHLAWSSQEDGIAYLFVKDIDNDSEAAQLMGSGISPAWSPDGEVLAGIIRSPIHQSLVGYRFDNRQLVLPPMQLPGSLKGISWGSDSLYSLISLNFPASSDPIPHINFQKILSDSADSGLGRYNLVVLENVTVPYPFIQDNADESFSALRDEVALQSGWDLLGNLENIFLPITEPPHPGLVDEWLFTGRAFALVSNPIQAGWMYVVRESFPDSTYWRVWVRTRYQDGSQGEPIRMRPWNLDARLSGDPQAYEQGGENIPAPEGYWLDFTELASRFGWTPLPALSNWRTYYPAARFNQFVFSEGLDWESAMAQIYPPEAVHQPTSIPSQELPLLQTPSPVETTGN